MNTSSAVWPLRTMLRSLTTDLQRSIRARMLPRQRDRNAAVPGANPPGQGVPPGPALPLCRLEDIPDGGVRGFDPPDPQGLPLLLMREGGRVHGWLNVCPQDGRRMNVAPGLFRVEHGNLRCAIRGAVFALRDGGRCVSGPCRGRPLVAVPLRVEQGLVLRDRGLQSRDG